MAVTSTATLCLLGGAALAARTSGHVLLSYGQALLLIVFMLASGNVAAVIAVVVPSRRASR